MPEKAVKPEAGMKADMVGEVLGKGRWTKGGGMKFRLCAATSK